MPLLTPVGLPCAAPNVKLQCETPVLTPVWASAELHAAGIHCEAPLGGGSIGGSTMEFQWGGSSVDSNEKSECGAPVWPSTVEPQRDALLHLRQRGGR